MGQLCAFIIGWNPSYLVIGEMMEWGKVWVLGSWKEGGEEVSFLSFTKHFVIYLKEEELTLAVENLQSLYSASIPFLK